MTTKHYCDVCSGEFGGDELTRVELEIVPLEQYRTGSYSTDTLASADLCEDCLEGASERLKQAIKPKADA